MLQLQKLDFLASTIEVEPIHAIILFFFPPLFYEHKKLPLTDDALDMHNTIIPHSRNQIPRASDS